VSASELVTRVTKAQPTFKTAKGDPVVKPLDPTNDRYDVYDTVVPTTGISVRGPVPGMPISEALAKGFIGSKDVAFFSENNKFLQFLAKVAPGVQSGSVFHDSAIGQFFRTYRSFPNPGGIFTKLTIPPLFAVNYVALGVPQIAEDIQLVDDDAQ